MLHLALMSAAALSTLPPREFEVLANTAYVLGYCQEVARVEDVASLNRVIVLAPSAAGLGVIKAYDAGARDGRKSGLSFSEMAVLCSSELDRIEGE